MDDLISRQAAIDAVSKGCQELRGVFARCEENLLALPPAQQSIQQWIPFETRPLTAEEKEEHPEWDCVLECKLPDDGQRILVSINLRGHEKVQYDEFYTDGGSYLDSEYEIGSEATAWMPLPEPYKETAIPEDDK